MSDENVMKSANGVDVVRRCDPDPGKVCELMGLVRLLGPDESYMSWSEGGWG
jgi:hypothetical protein